MIRVGVSGASGRMGSLVCEAVAAEPDLELVARFDPEQPGDGSSGDPAALAAADVVVEFTRPDVVFENLARWRKMGLHAVVGTSGFTEERLDRLSAEWGDGPPNCLVAPNFSVGAVLAMRFAELAAPFFEAAEVIELHHDQKADAPSGTAVATAGRIGRAAEQRRRIISKELVAGARGADVEGVPVHAIRLPGLVAHQEVVLGGTGETLTLRHDTTDRSAFVPGVLMAVRRIAGLPGVTVGIEVLLGI